MMVFRPELNHPAAPHRFMASLLVVNRIGTAHCGAARWVVWGAGTVNLGGSYLPDYLFSTQNCTSLQLGRDQRDLCCLGLFHLAPQKVPHRRAVQKTESIRLQTKRFLRSMAPVKPPTAAQLTKLITASQDPMLGKTTY